MSTQWLVVLRIVIVVSTFFIFIFYMFLISALNTDKHFVWKFYLVDSGYSNDVDFRVLFRSITYHLEEFKRKNGGSSEREEVFNYTHSSLRNIVEQTFGVWKER